VVLSALVPGLIEMVRRRNERGFVLLRVLAVFLIVPYSLMAAKFLRYSLPMVATVDLIAAVGVVSGGAWLLRKSWLPKPARVATVTVALVVFGAGVVLSQQTAAPYYSLFENTIGTRVNTETPAFSEETYDYGVREAVNAIAAVAMPDAVVVSDADSVVAHYLGKLRRPDIGIASLSAHGLPRGGHEAWVIVQDEHLTFENQQLVAQLRARWRPWREIRIDDRLALQIFRMETP
jgi:hypothetical protein